MHPLKICVLLLLFISCTTNAQTKTVYITTTGKKYHIETCRYLKHSKHKISLEKAKARGYTSCKVCTPKKSTHSNKNTSPKTVSKDSSSIHSTPEQRTINYMPSA